MHLIISIQCLIFLRYNLVARSVTRKITLYHAREQYYNVISFKFPTSASQQQIEGLGGREGGRGLVPSSIRWRDWERGRGLLVPPNNRWRDWEGEREVSAPQPQVRSLHPLPPHLRQRDVAPVSQGRDHQAGRVAEVLVVVLELRVTNVDEALVRILVPTGANRDYCGSNVFVTKNIPTGANRDYCGSNAKLLPRILLLKTYECLVVWTDSTANSLT